MAKKDNTENTRWTKHFDKRMVEYFNNAGFITNKDFDKIPAMGLFMLIGADAEEMDCLLKALFYEENTWRRKENIIHHASSKQGREYLREIFYAYDFEENPDWFYKMSIRDFLDLEFIEERLIPYVTALMKDYIEERDLSECFSDKKDLEENFESVIGRIYYPTFDNFGLSGYDEDYDDRGYYADFERYERWHS